jgi:transportin-1
MAGLLLKTNIKLSLAAIPPHVLDYVKSNVFTAIGDPVQMIRNTVGTVIDTLLIELGPQSWPEALSTLIELLDSPERFVQEVSALSILRDVGASEQGSAESRTGADVI